MYGILAVIKNIQKTTAHTNRQGSSSLNSMKTMKYSKNVGIHFIVTEDDWMKKFDREF